MRTSRVIVALGLAGLLGISCGGEDDPAGQGGTGGGAAGGGSGGAAGTAGSAAGGVGATAGTAGTGGTAGDGGPGDGSAGTGGACVVTTCQGKTYQCGDCIDNDGDGKIDMNDPDCLGPCDNNESGFSLGIPGANNAPCRQDCYFDQDTGPGNDECYWNHECDPKAVGPAYPPSGIKNQSPLCEYDPNANTPGTGQSCTQLMASQSSACGDFCGPLTPNGCDCFGCCELGTNIGTGKYVWLGSTDDTTGANTCVLGDETDPSKCKPCTPVAGCLNTCEKCELCIGKTTLPADCFPPDGGTGGAGGTGGTGGGGQVCPTGAEACGLPSQPPCPALKFCLTGCCQPVPS